MKGVYFIRAGNGPVKIGHSCDVQRRCEALQSGHYERLVLIRTEPGGLAAERHFQRLYAHLKISGEWFTFDPSMAGEVPTAPEVKARKPKGHIPQAYLDCARKFGVNYAAVKKWSSRGNIPIKYRAAMLLDAQS